MKDLIFKLNKENPGRSRKHFEHAKLYVPSANVPEKFKNK